MKPFTHFPIYTFSNLHIYTFLLCLCFAQAAEAHLSGQVVDENGAPLVGANVYWAGTGVGTATNADGLFEVEPIRQTKQLVASYLGYQNDTLLITDRSPILFALFPNDAELDEVTITRRRMDVVRNRLSTFDTQMLGAGELCKAACCNLSESFETNASVDVAYADAATGAKQIRLLGLSGTYVQLLGENCPAVRGLAQNFGMEYIPGPWMESIQVSKGTSSVKNGYEAITGQINVEYLKPQTTEPLSVNAMVSSELHAEVNLTGGWDIPTPHDPMLGKLSTGILAHYQNGSYAMDDNGDGFLDMPLNQNLNLLNRWYYKNDKYTFQFLVRGLHDERQGGQRQTTHWGKKMQHPLPAAPYLIDLNTDRVDAFMKNGFILDEESGMSIGIITSGSYHDQLNRYGQTSWDASQWNGYLSAMFENNWENDNHNDNHNHNDNDNEDEDLDIDHKLSTGVSLNYDRYSELLVRDGRYDLSRQELTPGVYGEYTLKVGDQFSMIAGLRLDYSTLYRRLFVTPRMNVRYAPFEWWTIRASAGLGYRSPNLVADYAQFLPSSRRLHAVGPTDLSAFRPEQEQSLNAGLSTTFLIPMGSKHLQLTADYYYTTFFRGMLADVDASRHEVQFINMSEVAGAQSRSHNMQIEATMEIVRGLTATGAFRMTDVRQTSLLNGEYRLREKALQNRFKGIVTLSYQTPLKKWQFDATAQFNGGGRMPDGLGLTGRQYRTAADGTTSYCWYPQLMAQVTKYWRHCSLYVGGENLTNFRMDSPVLGARDDHGMILATSPDFDASMVWGPISGWKVYIGFRYALDRKEDD